MQERDEGPEGEGKLKAQCDIEKDADHAQCERNEGAFGEFQADLGSHGVLPERHDTAFRKCLLEFGEDFVGGSLQAAEGEHLFRAFAFELDDHSWIVQSHTGLGNADGLGGIDDQKVTATEIDAEIFLATHGEDGHRSADEDQRDDECDPAFPEEIKGSLRHEVEHCDFGEAEFVDHPAEPCAGEEKCGEHRGDDAKGERDGESLH